MDLLTPESAIFAAVAFLAILVLSFVGFAAALVAMPILALFLDPKLFVPSFTLVTMTTMAALVIETRRNVQWRKIAPLLCGAVVGIPLGAYGLKELPVDSIRLAISATVLAFGLLFLFKVELRVRERLGTELATGFVSGVLGGSMATSGPPVVLLGISRNWAKEVFRANLLAYFLCLNVWANANFLAQGLHSLDTLSNYLVAVVPACLGAWIGLKLKERAGEELFRNVVLGVIIATSIIGLVARPKAHREEEGSRSAQRSTADETVGR